MAVLHIEKRCIRGLSVAESYRPGDKKSVLAGVVMRGDMVVDGFAIGQSTISGSDATDALLKMYRGMGRNDISYMLVYGTIISHYNKVDTDSLWEEAGIPVVGMSGRTRRKVRSDVARRQTVMLHTGHTVYVKISGCTIQDASMLLNRMTIQGGMPEPLRLARTLASTLRG